MVLMVRRRHLDDEELDSGDDLDRNDRVPDQAIQETEDVQRVTMDMEVPRQPVPEPSDGETYLLKVPLFLGIEPQAWNHTTFQPPTTDHHSNVASEAFSAYNTALSTVRWRRSPSDESQLQSNARILRWSDGSMTMQLASNPSIQYELDGNALAPPQRNPVKPTPTSLKGPVLKGKRSAGLDEKYEYDKDGFTYLLRPYAPAESLIVTNKVTTSLTVKQSGSVEDDAIERLQADLAAASNATKVAGATGKLITVDIDPEKARLDAQSAMKEKDKAEKRRQNAVDRENARNNRAIGRAGMPTNRYSGLNVGMLEDDEMGEGQTYERPAAGRAKPRRRRNSEYSEDEDFGRRRFTKEDEYDEEDDFLVGSDEEEEVVEDDDDSNDGIVEETRPAKSKSPKQDRDAAAAEDEEGDADADAPGDEDDADEEDMQQSRTKRRRIVDDEDEDE